jgi:hypothetical protein
MITVAVGVRGIAISLIMQATFTTALGSAAHRSVPRASSLVNSTRCVAQALGVAVLATVLASSISDDRQARGDGQGMTTLAAVDGGLCGGREPRTREAPVANPEAQQACEDHLRGLRRAYTVTFYASLIALATGAFLPGWPLEWSGRGRGDAARAAA